MIGRLPKYRVWLMSSGVSVSVLGACRGIVHTGSTLIVRAHLRGVQSSK